MQYFVDVLEADDNYKLQSFCWYNMARHFGLRGMTFCEPENTDIEIRMGEDGNKFFVLNTDFLTKNSEGGIQSNKFQTCSMTTFR